VRPKTWGLFTSSAGGIPARSGVSAPVTAMRTATKCVPPDSAAKVPVAVPEQHLLMRVGRVRAVGELLARVGGQLSAE